MKGTSEEGLILNPNYNYKLECYIEADFAGLWSVEDDQDLLSVKSRSGFVITFMDCLITWLSKLQTQISLFTMEAEYISLLSLMRELVVISVFVTLTTKLLGNP